MSERIEWKTIPGWDLKHWYLDHCINEWSEFEVSHRSPDGHTGTALMDFWEATSMAKSLLMNQFVLRFGEPNLVGLTRVIFEGWNGNPAHSDVVIFTLLGDQNATESYRCVDDNGWWYTDCLVNQLIADPGLRLV